MKNSELQLADVISRPGTIGAVTVKQIEDGQIHFFRPYSVTADFSWTGGVLCYIGIEEWYEDLDNTRSDWTLVSRKVLR